MTTTTINAHGIAFIEFSGTRPYLLRDRFFQMNLREYVHQTHKDMTFHHSGEVYFISNPTSGGHAEKFRRVHQRGVSAIGLLVDDSAVAYQQALALQAQPASAVDYDIPAINGVGETLIYLVDKRRQQQLFAEFGFNVDREHTVYSGIFRVDHLTHNLKPGGIAKYKNFYQRLFGFESVRSFEIEGKKTGLYSEVVASQDGRVIIPLNETRDEKSQIAEFIQNFNGEGVQHIALHTRDIYATVDQLAVNGIQFQDTPDTYYDLIDCRLPNHGEEVERLRQTRILIDGGAAQGGGFLLQIFTKNSIGPIFFEYIQRKGNQGFGEGNFQALFESIELDQVKRGVI